MVDRIRELCKNTNDTFASLEKKLEFGNGSIRKWDASAPSTEKLQKVADYFNVSTDYLLGRTPYKRPTDDPGLVWGYGTLVRDLTPDELEQLKSYVEMMIKAHDSEKKDK